MLTAHPPANESECLPVSNYDCLFGEVINPLNLPEYILSSSDALIPSSLPLPPPLQTAIMDTLVFVCFCAFFSFSSSVLSHSVITVPHQSLSLSSIPRLYLVHVSHLLLGMGSLWLCFRHQKTLVHLDPSPWLLHLPPLTPARPMGIQPHRAPSDPFFHLRWSSQNFVMAPKVFCVPSLDWLFSCTVGSTSYVAITSGHP